MTVQIFIGVFVLIGYVVIVFVLLFVLSGNTICKRKGANDIEQDDTMTTNMEDYNTPAGTEQTDREQYITLF